MEVFEECAGTDDLALEQLRADCDRNSDDICGDAVNPSSQYYICLDNLGKNSDLACSAACRSVLEQFADRCLVNHLKDALYSNIERVCGDATRPRVGDATSATATLLVSGISTLLLTVTAAALY